MSVDFLDKLAREPHTEVMSCELDLGISDVVDRVWKELRLIRIYTKRYASQVPKRKRVKSLVFLTNAQLQKRN